MLFFFAFVLFKIFLTTFWCNLTIFCNVYQEQILDTPYALSFYRSQNVLCWYKFFEPALKFIYILCHTKIWFAFSKIGFSASTKVFEEALNAVNVLVWSKFFVPEQKFIYTSWQSQTFCARQKDDLHSVKLVFVLAQKFLKMH